MRKIKVAELVLDFDLYPRNNIDSHNVGTIAEAMVSGTEMPPIIIDRKSKRVIDGFHRVKATAKHLGEGAEILCIEKNYKDEGEMFLDAARLNATHGCKLDPCDRVRCAILAEKMHITLERLAGALHMTVDRLSQLRDTRTGKDSSGQPLQLKRTVAEKFSGKKLTKRQEQANEKLSGMNQAFYANQLIELIESEMLDTDNQVLMGRLTVLNRLLDGILAIK